jgi:multidrug efflux pump subunit AcrA (membrane-fusion protein)
MTSYRRFSNRLRHFGAAPGRSRHGGATIVGAAATLTLLIAAGGGIWWWWQSRPSAGDSNGILLHTVKRDDFELTVTERGEVEAFDVTEVRSLVKSNNTTGNAILRIVPEGTEVKKGDFLVELDSSALRTQRTSQKILVNAAKAAEVEAKNTYDTAVIAKREYLEGTNLQERQTIESERFVAEENLNRAKEYYAYSQKLASKGYVNELQLEADRFAVEKAKKDLDTAITKLHVLDEFTKPKMLSTLDSAILIAKAKWDSGQNSHELELEKLEEFDDQIAKCTMVAPEDGVVKYAHVTDGRGDQEFIVEEGTVVRERQVIITLPNAESMRVNLSINESLVQYVQPGLAAVISPVGFGDRVLHGEVERVNQYAEPTGWRQANVKEYKALVAIDQPTPELRAGMTAAVTIRCAEVPNALQVPVQAVYAHGRKLYCFVYKGGAWEAREVKPGPTNDKFFVIESGLNEGDQVAMNPRGYVDEVSLPKLSPEEAQRAVPQRAAGRRGRGEGRQGGAGRPGMDQGPGEQGGEQPGGEQQKPREPDGTQPGDTRTPTGSGAAAQADQTAASNTAAAPASGSGTGE